MFDANNRNIGAYGFGSTLSLSSTYAGTQACPSGGTGYCAAFAGDLKADPIVNGNSGSSPGLVNSGGTTTFDYYQVAFAPGPGYPGGYPNPISSAVFVNRVDCCANRVIQFNSKMQLLNYNGTVTSIPFTSNATISTFNFRAAAPAPTPDPTSAVQTSATNRLLNVRYVRINAAPANYLHFRELYVFDLTMVNVALLKNVTSSAQYSALYPAQSGVDGVIDFDNGKWYAL